MTYRELMEEVIHLGFDSAVEDLGALCSATNRAVAQLRRELCPATGRFLVTVREPLFLYRDEIAVKDGDQLSFTHPALVAISFESFGIADVCIEVDGEVLRTEHIASPAWRERKILFPANSGAVVVMKNANGLFVRNVAGFAIVDGADKPEALPVFGGPFAKFDINAYCDDFLALDGDPYNEIGMAVKGYDIYGNTLLLPVEEERVEVVYRRRLRVAKMEDFSDGCVAVPDVPEEYADMLPLCVASYVWADLEPEKATHYKQMYNEQLQYARLQQQHRGKCRVNDRKGWR